MSGNPYLAQMESSNFRFEFLLDQWDASQISGDYKQAEHIDQLMDMENKHFRLVADKARKLLQS